MPYVFLVRELFAFLSEDHNGNGCGDGYGYGYGNGYSYGDGCGDGFGDGKTVKRAPAKSSKVGRNDPCPCGSGQKYKKCCGRNSTEA